MIIIFFKEKERFYNIFFLPFSFLFLLLRSIIISTKSDVVEDE